MDLDCTLEYGVCHDVIKKCRKDWSLAHDVKLLKFLEKFSQSLISRTGEALKSLESFENDLSSLSISIQTVSQRFQSLANKQFIEHCVLEDDILSYTKQNCNVVEVPSSTQNELLSSALKACLSSFHAKYSSYKDSYSVTKTSYGSSIVSSEHLPPLIGSSQFDDYYFVHLLSAKDKLKGPMQSAEVNTGDNASDKQSLQDSLSLHSNSNAVLDEDSNSFLSNHVSFIEVDPANNSLPGDVETNVHGIYSSVVNSIKNSEHTKPSENLVPQDSMTIRSNGYESILKAPKSQSLFDDDDSEADPDDLFSFGQTKPFSEKAFVDEEEEKEDIFPPSSRSNMSLPNSSNTISSKKYDLPRPSPITASEKSLKIDSYLSDKVNTSTKVDSDITSQASRTTKVNSSDEPTDKLTSTILKSSFSNSTVKEVEKIPDKEESSIYKPTVIVKEPFPSSITSDSKEQKFSLFSDQEESDDELFSSSKQKNAKENFKKILEGKISAFGGNANFTGKLNKNKYEDSSNSSDYPDKSVSFESCEEPQGESLLPTYKTSPLHSLVKDRPRIRNRRRLPTRKHLKSLKSEDTNAAEKMQKEEAFKNADTTPEECGSAVSILSPSTEEEDLFVVPTTSLIHEQSSSNLFLDSSLLSPGSSLDNQSQTNVFTGEERSSESGYQNGSSYNSVESDIKNSLEKDPSFFSGEPPSISGLKFDSNEDVSGKKTDPSMKFSWNNRASLFNDSDEDDDDLFSNVSKNKVNEKPAPPTLNKIQESLPANQSKLSNDFFKDIFSNNSDDDDLFKAKDTSTSRSKPNSLLVKPHQEKSESVSESNGSKSVKKTNAGFKDPLSWFNENQGE